MVMTAVCDKLAHLPRADHHQILEESRHRAGSQLCKFRQTLFCRGRIPKGANPRHRPFSIGWVKITWAEGVRPSAHAFQQKP